MFSGVPPVVVMERWSGAERAVAVRAYYKNGDCVAAARREYRRHFNLRRHDPVPSAHAIRLWVQNFESTGSALKNKPAGRPRSCRSQERIEEVQNVVTNSPKRSVRKIAAVVGMSSRSVHRILSEELKLHPYKIQVVQHLNETDYEKRMNLSVELLAKIRDNEDFLRLLWMSDEAHFHLSGYVNKQNCRYWCENNPHELHQRPLHSPKVTVWCAVSAMGIIGPFFFEDAQGRTTTVTSQRYAAMIETFLAPALEQFPANEYWFQQDGATSHSARLSMGALRTLFGNHIISRNGDIVWPPRSPDLSVCDYFLWGFLKHRVYASRPHTLPELKDTIRAEIRNIPIHMLERAVNDFHRRLSECQRENGGHLQDVIFKT